MRHCRLSIILTASKSSFPPFFATLGDDFLVVSNHEIIKIADFRLGILGIGRHFRDLVVVIAEAKIQAAFLVFLKKPAPLPRAL